MVDAQTLSDLQQFAIAAFAKGMLVGGSAAILGLALSYMLRMTNNLGRG